MGLLGILSGVVLLFSLGEEGGGLSARPDHYETRSLCLEKFSQVYGYLPLKTSRLIMNKVSYHI